MVHPDDGAREVWRLPTTTWGAAERTGLLPCIAAADSAAINVPAWLREPSKNEKALEPVLAGYAANSTEDSELSASRPNCQYENINPNPLASFSQKPINSGGRQNDIQ